MASEVQGVIAMARGEPTSVATVVVPDPGPGEAVVQVQACGVCHTDLHYREGGINDEFPFLLGHEAAGVVEAVRELTGGNGADVCIEAVGNPTVMTQAFYARDLAGTLVQVGVPTPDMQIELPMIDFFGRGGRLKPSWYGDCLPERDFPVLVDLYLQGRLDLDRFVSETIPLDGVEEAFARMQRGEVLRSVVTLGR